ncbi:hypothetical protein ZIOFF_003894 [Zingiber officinale]|uniref:Uncharacterized protein n=1 Tax=Zingiber officinale TaxID=94328 RepID=A0A8J5HYB9_ZINOF|nr:hypothetical protein ZIOFF_003894 [Zingiber officinale]
MKELVSGERSEMEEACRRTHIEPEMSTAPEKACALLDSCLVDPSELLANIEKHILKVKQEYVIRKEIIDRVNKEGWLEEYDKDTSKCTAGRGTHLNLKRAENARVTVSKIPAPTRAITIAALRRQIGCLPVTSAGDATPELLAPHSYSGRYNCCFKETRRLSTAPLNFVAMPEDAIVQSSIAGF